MSVAAGRGGAPRWARLPRVMARFVWNVLRTVLVALGAALGPGVPPPPPPPPQGTEQQDTAGEERAER